MHTIDATAVLRLTLSLQAVCLAAALYSTGLHRHFLTSCLQPGIPHGCQRARSVRDPEQQASQITRKNPAGRSTRGCLLKSVVSPPDRRTSQSYSKRNLHEHTSGYPTRCHFPTAPDDFVPNIEFAPQLLPRSEGPEAGFHIVEANTCSPGPHQSSRSFPSP